MTTLTRNPRGKVQVGNLPDSKSLTDREYQWIGSTGAGDILGTLIVAQGKELTTYFVDVADADGEPGRAYLLAKQHQRLRSGRLSPDPVGVYRVFLGINGTRRHCSCPGFGRHGTCKHSDATAELFATGSLERGDCAVRPHAPASKAPDPPEPEPGHAEEPEPDFGAPFPDAPMVFPDSPLDDWPDDLRNEPTYADADDEYPDAGEPEPDHWTDDGGEG